MADVISRLRLESGEFDSKIKRAGQELLAYSSHCRKMGLEMGYANKDAQDFARQLGNMATVSQTARGKISELSEAFVNAKVMYKNMTDEEKNNTFGKNLAASLDQLKIRIEAAKQDFADANKELAGGGKFGDFGNVIDTLGSKLGVTGNLTEMLTSKTAMLTGAVGAGIAIVTKATEAWAGYNAELAKQDQITTVTTGLKGDDADRMTDKMRALSDTYNVDFREAVNAANTLMTQFGKTGDEATQLIKDGMQGMIQGDGPKLLSMIQQYAPAFRDAGVTASQLVAVIQNSEGGIFTDQNMNAIVMGIKNIRLMTKATSDALAQLGIDGQKMSQQLSNGSLTIFDALKQVASAVQGVDSNSKAAGEVMQQVFGRQGAMAGTKLGEAIATLNTNLEETKRQTGEVGGALAELQTANERLNTAIRDCFEYDGWDNMANGIKTKLVTALATVLEYIGRIKNSLSDFLEGNGIKGSGGYSDIEKTQKWINNGKDDNERRSRYDKAMGQLQTKLNNVGKERLVRNSDGSTSFVIDDEKTQAKKRAALQKRMSMLYATSFTPKPDIKHFEFSGSGGGGNGNTERNLDEEQKVQAKINALLKEALTADAQRLVDIRQQVADLQKQQEKYKDIKNIAQGILPKDKEAVFTINALLTEETKKALSDIKGVTIDDKTMTVTANTSDALKALQGIEGVTIDSKSVTITATDEAMPKLREIQGITIDDKTMTVTANTSDALKALQGIEGVTIDPKSVTITATDEALPKLREIQGITIDDKTMTVTANTSDALKALQGIEGVTIDPKSVTITATDEALPKLREIQGITIDDKTMTVTAETADALRALQGIEGVTIDPKTVTITATDEALPKLREIQGITIDDKTMTVTAETADALRALQGIEGVTIDPKTVTITATDEALPKLREIQGISIDDKNLTITANTQEAMQKVQELIGDVTEIKLMPIKPVITDDDIDNILRKQYGQAIEVPVIPKMSAGDELVQSIRLDLAQSIQETDAQTLRTLLEAQIKNGIEGIEIPANSIIDQIFGEGANIPDEYWQNLQDQINEKLKEMGIDPINIDFSTGKAKDEKGNSDKEFKEFNAKAGQFISGLANVSNGLKGLGLQLPEGVDQLLGAISSVMQVIQGVNTVIGVFSASAMSANTAAIIANTAALYANSFLSVFANGGIVHAANGWAGTVPGNSYSGDNIPIMANAGEVVLTRAMAGNLASQLEGGGLGDLQLELRVDAEELIIMLNNNGKRRGLGRLING